jgi:DNA polymerase-4
LAENAGIETRGNKLGAARIQLAVTYSDGARVYGEDTGRRLFVTDREIANGAERIYHKVVGRRLRVRAITLTLRDTRPLGWTPDLFLPEGEDKGRRLQEAADRIRNRYGINSLMTGAVMAASGRGLSAPGIVHA